MSKASRLGLREVKVHFGTFDFTMICLVGPYAGVEEYIRWKFEDPAFSTGETTASKYPARGRTFRRHGYLPVLWLPRRPRTAVEHGTLAHECLHVVQLLMEWADIRLNFETEEAYCHALGHAVREILTKLAKP